MKSFPQPPLIKTRYPVVLMHGFGTLASIRRGGHLHEEAMSLRAQGVWAYAPNVAPYNTVAIRAPMWKKHLEFVLEETGARKLNLIAQSMGGLDARFAISRLGMADRVASLVTVSTPHRGSAIADWAGEQPSRIRETAAVLANWLGTKTLPDANADFLNAVTELSPEHITRVFNPKTPDHPSVRYWSYAGQAGKGTDVPITPVLRFLNNILYEREGVNDGFVSIESARWGNFLGTITADHAQEVGISLVPGSEFNSNEFYSGVVKMLADEGF